MAKKLHYFHFNGIAESIRLILHYAGQKFEDIRYDRNQWPIQSVKDSLPFGQFPLYEEGDRSLNQSLAIARYLAGQYNLLPSDPWEQAVLDADVFNIYDFLAKVFLFIREKDLTKKQTLKKALLELHVDYYLSRFEKTLRQNNGHFGGKLTWADFILVGIVEATNLFLEAQIETKYPTVMALLQKVRSLPGVKEYVANRDEYINNEWLKV